MNEDMGTPIHLACSRCGKQYAPNALWNVCECGGPLLANYDLAHIRERWDRSDLQRSTNSMWRYAPVLPAGLEEAVTLREGWTPLIRAGSLGEMLGASDLWIKDEARNPTDSFKARGLSCAVTMAQHLGAKKLAIASGGNAASALAAYGAAASVETHIFMPRETSQANFLECKVFGANVTLVNGTLSKCAKIISERKECEGWFEVGTLKEPYRIEGSKTMGYEVAEQFQWRLPDAILYPCGGGEGLIGMWKAFDELQTLGWIKGKRPKLIAVQAAGCNPITRALRTNAGVSSGKGHTVAKGLQMSGSLGDLLVVEAIRKSGGTALSISDEDLIDGAITTAREEGIFVSPEAGACVAALQRLLQEKFLRPDEKIIIFNTGSGVKYQQAYGTRFPRHASSEQDKLGGLITPR